MLSRVRIFEMLNFPIFLYFELVDVFIELCNFVHEALIPSAVLSHLMGVLLEEPIFLELYLLKCLHFLRNLLLQFLFEGYDYATAII